MIELPEACSLAGQITGTIVGKKIVGVTAGHTPHKLAWYYGDVSKYSKLLIGETVTRGESFGGFVEVRAGGAILLFGEGVNLRFHQSGERHPAKHQLLVELDDGSALSAAVQMYGGMGVFEDGGLDNPYYHAAKEKPSPLTEEFDERYFRTIVCGPGVGKLSLKALLATEQRVPGLGNGVLQDILFNARMHPKRKAGSLSDGDVGALCKSIKGTLRAMTEQGGRNTELDLFGHPGGYRTILSKNTVGRPCPACGALIKKEAYMGGTVYYCESCQRK